MRLWSLHPSMLDSKGLVACWREAKLALAVLENKTNGYKFHPQLDRFKATSDPIHAVKVYLRGLYDESLLRGYNFDESCIADNYDVQINVNDKQLEFEFQHLLNKVSVRSPKFNMLTKAIVHPIFVIVQGPIEGWEKL